MASSHPAKRPYAGSQPCITNYFPQTSTSSQPTYSITSPSSIPRSFSSYESPASPLPPNVQSNLLSVGMRVRKSVPEGYKTGSTYNGFSLFSDNSNSLATSTEMETQQKSPRVGGTRPRARELTPFCGILKVGGLGTQQWGIYDISSSGREEESALGMGVDEVPFLSSQGSTVSNSSVESVYASPNGNKRRFDGEDEDEERIQVLGDGAVVLGMGLGQRVMAVPRRRKFEGQGKMAGIGVVQQENLLAPGQTEDVDFEEADFLDYGLVGEVEMGGV